MSPRICVFSEEEHDELTYGHLPVGGEDGEEDKDEHEEEEHDELTFGHLPVGGEDGEEDKDEHEEEEHDELTFGHLPVGGEDGEEDKDEHEEEERDGADHAVAAHRHRLHEHHSVQEPGQRQPTHL